LRRGAAHVEGDRILDAEDLAHRLRADDSGRRAGLHHAHAVALRFVEGIEAAGGLHHHELAAEAFALRLLVDLLEIAMHARADVGVGDYGRGALELAIFLR